MQDFVQWKKKKHMIFFVWGAGMNFPKEQDFSKRLKFMGPFFLFKGGSDLLWFLMTRWVKKGSFILVIMIRQNQFLQALH